VSNLVISRIFEDKPIRSIEIPNSGIWYVAKDIAEILGYVDKNQAIRNSCNDVVRLCDILADVPDTYCKEIKELTKDWHPQTLLIQRPDISLLVSRSNKPEARQFQNWLFKEVVEDIYNTGNYKLEI
jgi:prophage antirepressor-like protein